MVRYPLSSSVIGLFKFNSNANEIHVIFNCSLLVGANAIPHFLSVSHPNSIKFPTKFHRRKISRPLVRGKNFRSHLGEKNSGSLNVGEICREGILIYRPQGKGGWLWVFGFGVRVLGIHGPGLLNHAS